MSILRILNKSCILSTEFNRPPNLVRDKGIYSTCQNSSEYCLTTFITCCRHHKAQNRFLKEFWLPKPTIRPSPNLPKLCSIIHAIARLDYLALNGTSRRLQLIGKSRAIPAEDFRYPPLPARGVAAGKAGVGVGATWPSRFGRWATLQALFIQYAWIREWRHQLRGDCFVVNPVRPWHYSSTQHLMIPEPSHGSS